MYRPFTALATVVALFLAAPVSAQDADPNVTARQSLMGLYGYNLAVLGGMAQGRMPYDADLATAAATSLYHLSRSGSARMWPEGTDNAGVEGSRALPAVWENMSDFSARFVAMQDASEALMNAAGTDLAALQAAMGPLGQSCGACHQTYRQAQ